MSRDKQAVRQWCATRTEDDGEYGETFAAVDASQARRLCAQRGWRLDGELVAVVPAAETTVQQMDALIARRNAGIASDA